MEINALRDYIAPATLNLDNSDPAVKHFHLVVTQVEPMDITDSLSKDFGFSRVNVSVLLKRWRDKSAGNRAGSRESVHKYV